MALDVPSPHVHRKSKTAQAGFSLVEICLALGIVAFALVPLVGLLAVGLDSYHNANLRGRAAQVVNTISSALRASTPLGNNKYAASAPFDLNGKVPLTWTLTSSPATTPDQVTIYFDENGEVVSAPAAGSGGNPPQMVAMVIITPPTTQFEAGKAQIAVAWPAFRAPSYSVTAGITFANPQGHDESTISFVANPR